MLQISVDGKESETILVRVLLFRASFCVQIRGVGTYVRAYIIGNIKNGIACTHMRQLIRR